MHTDGTCKAVCSRMIAGSRIITALLSGIIDTGLVCLGAPYRAIPSPQGQRTLQSNNELTTHPNTKDLQSDSMRNIALVLRAVTLQCSHMQEVKFSVSTLCVYVT